jgi:hypothetical protein
MKVLVVQQPWAWLIVNKHKDIENRTWKTKHRGPLLIQASAAAIEGGYGGVPEVRGPARRKEYAGRVRQRRGCGDRARRRLRGEEQKQVV